MRDIRGFFLSDQEIFRRHPDRWQEKATKHDGKKTGQTVFSGYEYSSYSNASTCSRSGMERMAPFLVVTR